MTARIDLDAPATITVVDGATIVSSLPVLPPYGIAVTDPGSGTLAVTLVAANAGAVLAASGTAGAAVVAQGNTLSLSGTAAEVNAALASLVLSEASTATSDLISVTASDPSVLGASTEIAVRIATAAVAGFASPPAVVDVHANSLTVIPGLVLGDAEASALTAAGLGRGETLEISLSVGNGLLLLPALGPASGVTVLGQGSKALSIIFSADQLALVNAALAGLSYIGPAQTQLSYRLTNLSGPLGAFTSSNMFNLNTIGSAGGNGTFVTGGDTLIVGGGTIAAALQVSGLTVDTGALSDSLFVGGAGTLVVPNGVLSLTGTSDDFGAVLAAGLNVTGILIGDGGSFGGEMSLGPAGLIDFGGTLIAEGNATTVGQAAVTLAAGGVIRGGGALLAGNAAHPGMILGAGTLLAGGGETLAIEAGRITGGALRAAGGGVLELEPLGTASLTVGSAVTLGFAAGYGVAPVSGGYADSLAQDGGVIVIDDPLAFSGTITGLMAGDRLVLPGLSGLTLSSVTSQSFVVSGLNGAGQQQNFTLHAAIPTGGTLFTALDAEGDAEIGLRAAGPAMFVDGGSFGASTIGASEDVGQILPGLQILVPGWTGQSLTLTLSVGEGVLAFGAVTPAASLVLTAASPTALNALLAEVVYTATLSATTDTLVASSGTGLLSGLNSPLAITIEPGGTVAAGSIPPTDEQTLRFAGSTASSTLVTAAAAPGAVLVSGAADFADVLVAGGIGGTALSVDGGGSAIFDAGSEVSLAADAMVGDAGGAGTLGILSSDFAIGSAAGNADLVIGGNTAAAGSVAEIIGSANVAGNVLLGQKAAALLDVSGTLSAMQTTIGTAGTLIENSGGVVSYGALLDGGTLVVEGGAHGAAQATAQQLVLSGQLSLDGGSTLSGLSSAVIATGGALVVAQDAALDASGLSDLGGNILVQGALLVGGNLLSEAAMTLAGGLIEAAAASLSSGGTLSGHGALVATDGRIVLSGGELLASGGLLSLDGAVTMSGTGSIVVAGTSGLDLIGGAAGEILLAGSDAVVTINDLAMESAAVAGMVGSDVIDLVGVAPSLVSYAGGTISAVDHGGNPLGGFALGTQGSLAVEILSDGNGGALVTMGGEMACFARGTRLLTPNGYVPVEAFKPGDPIITRLGIRRAVRWIGSRNIETGLKARQDMRPVVVTEGAFGPRQPSRPVRLSPSHAVFVDGVLVPVMHLVNGATIVREPRRGAVTYFHLELDRHDVLVAEGLAVESYIDTGNRGEFRHEQGLRGSAGNRCAALVTHGPRLARIRRRLHEIALGTGFMMAQEPALRGVVGEEIFAPELRVVGGMQMARFVLPADADRLLLLAHAAAPAETDPLSDDRRELALCIGKPRGPRLGDGWYPRAAGDKGIWMSGCGEILLAPATGQGSDRRARELKLSLRAVVRRWQPRPVDLTGAGF